MVLWYTDKKYTVRSRNMRVMCYLGDLDAYVVDGGKRIWPLRHNIPAAQEMFYHSLFFFCNPPFSVNSSEKLVLNLDIPGILNKFELVSPFLALLSHSVCLQTHYSAITSLEYQFTPSHANQLRLWKQYQSKALTVGRLARFSKVQNV